MPGLHIVSGTAATRRCVVRFALAASCTAMVVGGAAAQPSHRAARKSQPAPLARTAPDVTSTIAPAKPSPSGQAQGNRAEVAKPPVLHTVDLGETLPKPFDLPAASRPRMRACGEKWQAIKLSGQAGSETWRDFATKCLTEHADAARKASR